MTAQPDPDARIDQWVAAGPAGGRRTGAPTKWVPVDQLSTVARALLSDDLGGRDVVPRHVADRVTRQAIEWEEQGFTAETVRPWRDVPPAAAGYLVQRGVSPRVLDLPVDAIAGAAPVALRLAIESGRMPVERAYELLVLTGEHRPDQPAEDAAPGEPQAGQPRPAPVGARPAGPQWAAPPSTSDEEPASNPPRPVTPVIFSHPDSHSNEVPESSQNGSARRQQS
jgi:hypothetical protein